MARRKTKKQKRNTDVKVSKLEDPQLLAAVEEVSVPVATKKQQSQTTIFSQTQVQLLYKDLIKTGLVTCIVFIVLLSIFMYLR